MKYKYQVTIRGTMNELSFVFTSFTQATLFMETALNHAPDFVAEIEFMPVNEKTKDEKACE